MKTTGCWVMRNTHSALFISVITVSFSGVRLSDVTGYWGFVSRHRKGESWCQHRKPYFLCPAEQTGSNPLETFKPSDVWRSLPRNPRKITFLWFLREAVLYSNDISKKKKRLLRWTYGSMSMLYQASEFLQRPQVGLKHFSLIYAWTRSIYKSSWALRSPITC